MCKRYPYNRLRASLVKNSTFDEGLWCPGESGSIKLTATGPIPGRAKVGRDAGKVSIFRTAQAA